MLKKFLPRSTVCKIANNTTYYLLTKWYFTVFERPKREAETAKARRRREKECFFDKFCSGTGLDIGYGGDILTRGVGWDIEDGDAQLLPGVAEARYDYVYSSHTLNICLTRQLRSVTGGASSNRGAI
jgi:hypothetical protein